MSTGTYQFQSDFALELLARGEAKGEAKGEARGLARGEAKAILIFLGARGLPVPDELRARITSCSDLDQLAVWLERAATVDSVEELFTS